MHMDFISVSGNDLRITISLKSAKPEISQLVYFGRMAMCTESALFSAGRCGGDIWAKYIVREQSATFDGFRFENARLLVHHDGLKEVIRRLRVQRIHLRSS